MSDECVFPAVMALVFFPWLLVVLLTAGGWAAVNLLGYAVVVIGAGYAVIYIALPLEIRTEVIAIAPALGTMIVSALTAFWVRLGFSVVWAPAMWLMLAIVGAVCLWRDRRHWVSTTVAYGKSLAVISVLICAVYFLPGARNDAVLRRDGSFNWIYVDTQYNHGMAATIKNGSPPREPGTAIAELLYHFGEYAPAAAISRVDGLRLADAYARVTRGVSLWALVLSCFGLGTLLSLKATGAKFGGIASVVGFFFYGSLLSLFTDERNSSSLVTGAILFRIPKIEVPADGGPFSHLILGHSVLHSFCVITATMALCFIRRERGGPTDLRTLILLTLPILAVPVDSVAALYAIGIVSILLFWGRLRKVRSWLAILLLLGMFLASWRVMGYSHAPDAALVTINRDPGGYWWPVSVWITVGLGFRILAFRWVSNLLKDPVSALVFASVVGLLAFNLLFEFEHGQERYGLYFLQSVFSIFAFSRLTRDWWRRSERSRLMAEWLRLVAKGVFILGACGILLRLALHVMHNSAWVASISLQIVPAFFSGLLLIGLLALMKRRERVSGIGSAVLASILMVGFFAWISPWLNFGLGRMKMDVLLTPGEVRGLNQLTHLAAPSDRFATNKHAIDGVAALSERSYGYAAFSERPVLLEGYSYQGVTSLPWFNTLLRENDLMFSTTNPNTLRDLSKKWSVQWLVARPGTDIALPRPLPSWLAEEPTSGTLKIYKIN